MQLRLFMCENCGNVVAMIEESGVAMVCCGQEMAEVTPREEEEIGEKHVPVYRVEGSKVMVEVGSIRHPMEALHYIQWVCIETSRGMQIRQLLPGDEPKVCFTLCEGDTLRGVYAYCNIHGLWKAQ